MHDHLIAPKDSPPLSVNGALWQFRDANTRQVNYLAQVYNVPEIVARVLVGRGIIPEEAGRFLQPTLRDLLPDPLHLRDMEKAARRIVHAIVHKEKIAIFGDYDVDGATSSALLKRYFSALGADSVIYIPDRIEEGYGPNAEAMVKLQAKGATLCITVDCGTLAFQPIAVAKKAGMEVIVVDHHIAVETLPDAYAVINPNRLDDASPYGYLAAVGVTFLLVVAVQRILREEGHLPPAALPDILHYLDLVALGTVCDVVPLKGVNRAYVIQGLKILRQRQNIGLASLVDVAGLKEMPGTYHLGFVLGPRINAGGRVGEASLGARLLSTASAEEAHAIAKVLDRHNAERKAIEQLTLEEAIAQVEQGDVTAPVIIARGENWHPGVIGIVASRLKERYHRPVAVIALKGGIGKASARSLAGIDFGAAVVNATQSGLLVAGGGHAMAAGFTIAEDKIDALYRFLAERFEAQKMWYANKVVQLDGVLTAGAVTSGLAAQLQQCAPYGASNPEPVFMLENVVVVKTDILGLDHVRCIVADGMAAKTGKTLKCMAFRQGDTAMGKALLNHTGKLLHLAGQIRTSTWQGYEKAEFFIDDVMLA